MRRRLAVAVTLLGLAACGGRPPVEAAWVMPKLAPGEPGYPFAPASAVGIGGDEIQSAPRGDYPDGPTLPDESGFWRYDERRARREAEATGRGLFVAFYAEWSAPSRQLEEEALSDVQTRAAILARYVPLRVDVTEESMAGREQLERYGVDRLPALVMLGPGGAEEGRVEKALGAEALLAELQQSGR